MVSYGLRAWWVFSYRILRLSTFSLSRTRSSSPMRFSGPSMGKYWWFEGFSPFWDFGLWNWGVMHFSRHQWITTPTQCFPWSFWAPQVDPSYPKLSAYWQVILRYWVVADFYVNHFSPPYEILFFGDGATWWVSPHRGGRCLLSWSSQSILG